MDIFPFSAVIGQIRLKLALTLVAIDMKMGGLLISGPRGCAKSTLSRGLAAVSAISDQQFVTLPLSATEEKVVGSLHLERALQQGKVEFQPGLLQRAHQGILFIDEVNLLPDHLVDLLLDVAASGINTVERDGVSHCHAAQFVLIGTMNPAEGELRPQLLDRFGLCVELVDDYSLEERMEVVQRRLAFDDNPQQFLAQYASQQTQCQQQILAAREILQQVSIAPQSQRYLAELCQQANVEGVRADLTLFRAARAYVALQQRCHIEPADIDAVAEFALQHRAHPQDASTQSANTQSKQAASNKNAHHHQAQRKSSNEMEVDWGEMDPVTVLTDPKRYIDSQKKNG